MRKSTKYAKRKEIEKHLNKKILEKGQVERYHDKNEKEMNILTLIEKSTKKKFKWMFVMRWRRKAN